MNNNCIAPAVVALLASFSGAASAQATAPGLTVYGTLDAAAVRERGGAGGEETRVESGVATDSHIGLRGAEPLGSGWSAVFRLDAGIRLDTGESDSGGSVFGRQAYVGLRSERYGALTIGRQYTPYYVTIANVADPFGAGMAGTATNLLPSTGAIRRASNTVLYTSPTLRGFTGQLAYVPGEQAGSSVAGRQLGGVLAFSNGGLNVRLGYNHRNNDITAAEGAGRTPPVPAISTGIARNTLLAANYSLGKFTAYVAYGRDKGPNSAPLPNPANPYGAIGDPAPVESIDSRDMLVGLSMPFAYGTLMASHIRKDDRTVFRQDARQWGIGYMVPLSERTDFYAAYARIRNENGAGYTVGNNGAAGSGDEALNLGLRHSF